MTDARLWILFFSLFIILLLVVLYTLLRGCVVFLGRYCVCVRRNKWCCYVKLDWQAYRRERESLHRLRELRHRHRDFILRQHFSTFSQIPGPIPDSVWILPSNSNMGFIWVPNEASRPRSIREQLTAEQRRAVLERILTCQPYSMESSRHITHQSADEENPDICDMASTVGEDADAVVQSESSPRGVDATLMEGQGMTESSRSDVDDQDDPEPLTAAVPAHEEPIEPNCCAICLDSFIDGEQINQTSECPHFFHKDCLLGWLDQHDVCPCCRRVMVTEQEWKRAIQHEGIRLRHVHRSSSS